MKKTLLKRFFVTGTLFATIFSFNPLNFFSITSPAVTQAAVIPGDEIQADEISWVFRSHNGWLQKRRWNYTKGYWVDPNWITVKKI